MPCSPILPTCVVWVNEVPKPMIADILVSKAQELISPSAIEEAF